MEQQELILLEPVVNSLCPKIFIMNIFGRVTYHAQRARFSFYPRVAQRAVTGQEFVLRASFMASLPFSISAEVFLTSCQKQARTLNEL
jgi:hypothetical protein